MRFCIIFFLFLAINYYFIAAESSHLETYIVHVEAPTGRREMADLERYYLSFLPTTLSASTAGPGNLDAEEEVAHILFSYQHVFIGFAARLSEEDVNKMERKQGFISAEKEEIYQLDTTHTPNFLGLNRNTGGFWHQSNYGRGVIIGVLDTGINPDHPSFGDSGMPTPPDRWRGQCQFLPPRRCNNKLIGARRFEGAPEPLDFSGHGTHVAGIATGNFVAGANFHGNAFGTASGIAPLSHLAVYKVCSENSQIGCPESALLAGIDGAINDGVDILSISIGFGSRPFHSYSVAIGAFAAMQRGIFVSCSGGNDGPNLSTLSNEAPWVLTVGASTTDRQIRSTVVLGNNIRLDGQSAFQPSDFPSLSRFPLIYPGLTSTNDAFCARSQFPMDVRGRIVICLTGGVNLSPIQKGNNVRIAGGRAMILINQEHLGYTTDPDVHVLPASHVSYADGLQIISYVSFTAAPTATLLFQGTVFGDRQAPSIAIFSSRGPNQASNGILKPDILGPGVNILSASHNTRGYALMSGTSMSCPHLSGVAALLKSTRPNWSPAAIKSAIMTTADVVNRGNSPIVDHFHQPATLLGRGAGQVNPTRSNNPGLIYDLTSQDYINFICGLGYTPQQIQIIVGRIVDCRGSISQAALNYPSFSIVFGVRTQTYSRTVTNVGVASSTYTVRIEQEQGLQITVNPNTLRFTTLNQRITYQVTFRLTANQGSLTNESVHQGSLTNNFRLYQGSITWISGALSVRIPVVGLLNLNAAISPLVMDAEKLLPSM